MEALRSFGNDIKSPGFWLCYLFFGPIYAILALFLLLPLIHLLPWWAPFVFLVTGVLFDSITTAIVAAVWGFERFARKEMNQGAVRWVKRFGPVGVFLQTGDPNFLTSLGLPMLILGLPIVPLVVLGFANFSDIFAVPCIVMGGLASCVAINNAAYLLLDPVLPE